jgi:hypothetical protein
LTDAVSESALQTASEQLQDAAVNPTQDNPGQLIVEPKSKVDEAAAAAKAAAEGEQKSGDTPVYEFEPTGDPGLDLALDFVGKLGIDETNPAFAAAINGDFSLLDALLSSMGDKAKGYEKFIALAEKAYKESQAADLASKQAIATAVHNVVGGEAQWTAIQEWARTQATPEEKQQLNAMLIAAQYEKAGGVVSNPTSATSRYGASANGSPAPQAPLTRREAVAKSNELARRIGSHNLENSPEYKAIWSRVGR